MSDNSTTPKTVVPQLEKTLPELKKKAPSAGAALEAVLNPSMSNLATNGRTVGITVLKNWISAEKSAYPDFSGRTWDVTITGLQSPFSTKKERVFSLRMIDLPKFLAEAEKMNNALKAFDGFLFPHHGEVDNTSAEAEVDTKAW